MTTTTAPTTTLTDEELIALGDDPLLRDGRAESAWSALPEQAREGATAAARHGLIARGLLTPDGDCYELDPLLSVILRARHRPLRLMVARDVPTDPDAHPSRCLVAHGIDAGDDGPMEVLDGFVVEAYVDGMHRFQVVPVVDAIELMALWTVRPVEREVTGGRTLEIMRPGEGGHVVRVRFVADISGSQPLVAAVNEAGDVGEPLAAGTFAAAVREALAVTV